MAKKEVNKKQKSNKLKIILPISIVCVVVIAVTVTLLLVFRAIKPTPEKMAKEALDQALDLSIATNQLKEPEIITIMEEKNGYEILSLEENESEAIAKVRVYAPDLYSLAQNIPNTGWSSEAELEKEILLRLEKEKIVEKEVELVFIKGESEYQPVLTDEFVDAYYGGVLRLKEEYLLKMVEEMQND